MCFLDVRRTVPGSRSTKQINGVDRFFYGAGGHSRQPGSDVRPVSADGSDASFFRTLGIPACEMACTAPP
jgi:hypothetical protein